MTKKKVDYSHLNDAIGDGSGFEEMSLDTMAVPFIRVIQDLSPQLKKSKPEYNPKAKAGMLVNTVTGALYEPPLQLVVGKFERIFIEWGTNRGDFKGAHAPETIDLNTALIRNEKNQLVDPATGHIFSEHYNYYIVLPEHMEEGICLLSLSSSAIKAAKKLNRMLLHSVIPGTTQRAMPYFMVWDLTVVDMSNDQGDWYGVDFVLNSFVNQEVLDCVTDERKALPEKTVDYSQANEHMQIEAPSEEHF